MSNFISFLLPHDISKFELKKEHSILQILISPEMAQTTNIDTFDSYDCVILNCGINNEGRLVDSYEQLKLAKGESSGTRFGDIYIKFFNLGVKNIYSRLLMISESLLHRNLSEDEKRIALTKVEKIVKNCSEIIINISSQTFVLMTDLFSYRTLDKKNLSLLENLNTLHTNQLKLIFNSIGKEKLVVDEVLDSYHTDKITNQTTNKWLSDLKLGLEGLSDRANILRFIINKSTINPRSIKFTLTGYQPQQPDSFWVYTNDELTNNYYYPTSDSFKIHISINPMYINDALKCLLQFIVNNPLDNKYSEYEKSLSTFLLPNGTKPPTADDLELVSSLITQFKVQALTPSHLYKNNEEWSDWKGIDDRMPNGIGYIVIYPCKNYPFTDLMKLFIDYWVPNFEKKFPNAKRDNNYIIYNERITETIYITPTGGYVDTNIKQFALKSPTKNYNNIKLKQSDKIYNYINDYCRIQDGDSIVATNTNLPPKVRAVGSVSANKVQEDIKLCLNDKFHIKNIDCNTKGIFTNGRWGYQDVWLEENSEDSGLVTCDYDMDMVINPDIITKNIKNIPKPSPRKKKKGTGMCSSRNSVRCVARPKTNEGDIFDELEKELSKDELDDIKKILDKSSTNKKSSSVSKKAIPGPTPTKCKGLNKGPKGKKCHPNSPGCCIDEIHKDYCEWKIGDGCYPK